MTSCGTVRHLLRIPLAAFYRDIAKLCSGNVLPIGTSWVSRLVRAVPANIVHDPGQTHDLLRPVGRVSLHVREYI